MAWRDYLADFLRPRAPAPRVPVMDGEIVPDLELRPAALQRQVPESIAAIGGGLLIDPDDNQFTRISGGANKRMTRRDLTPVQQDRALEIAWYLWESNPLARRLIGLMTDLIIGEGVTVQAKDKKIQEQIDLTWNHRINQLATRHRAFYTALSLNGELILPAERNPITGRLVLGYLDPYQVKEVRSVSDNTLIADVVELKPETNQQTQGRILKVIRENPDTGNLEGEVFYFAINNLPNSMRGRSDLLPLADWLDLYDQYMFAEVERLGLMTNFVWDLTITGGTPKSIKERLAELPTPKPNSIFAHNEKEILEARTPDLKGQDTSHIATMLKTHIAGSMGFPATYLGESGQGNRATLQGQNDVMMKTPSARQKEFKAFLQLMIEFSLQGALTANPILFKSADPAFDVVMPEIAAKDVATVGAAIASIMQGLDTGLQNGTMSKRGATETTVAVLKHLGVELDPAEVESQIVDDEQASQDKMDQQQAAVARATAKAGGPGSGLAPDMVAGIAARRPAVAA